jgi:hypothetical protein
MRCEFGRGVGGGFVFFSEGVGAVWRGKFYGFVCSFFHDIPWMQKNDRRKEIKKKLTLVSLAANITIDICLRSRASLQQTTAVVTEKKSSDQRHVCIDLKCRDKLDAIKEVASEEELWKEKNLGMGVA